MFYVIQTLIPETQQNKQYLYLQAEPFDLLQLEINYNIVF